MGRKVVDSTGQSKVDKARLHEWEEISPVSLTIFDNLREGIIWADADGRITQANSVVLDMLGYSIGELQGMFLRDIIDPDELAEVLENQTRRNAGEDLPPVRRTWKRKNKSSIQVELWVSHIHDDSGEFIGQLACVRDISQEMAAQETIREREAKYRSLFDQAPTCYMEIRDGIITEANLKAEELFGYPRFELIGMLVSNLVTDKNELSKAVDELVRSANREDAAVSGHRIFVRKDGTEITVQFHGITKISPDGHRVSSVTGVDISEMQAGEQALHQSEEQLDTLFERGPISHFATHNGIVTSANHQAAETLGYSIDQLVGLSLVDLFPDKQAAGKRRNEVRKEFESSTDEWQHERTGARLMVRKDGMILRVTMRGHLSKGPNLSRLGFFTFIDVTHEREAEQQFLENESGYQALYENLGVGVLRLNLDCQIIDANPAMANLSGYSKDELTSMNCRELDDPKIGNACIDRRHAIKAGEEVLPLESQLKLKDESYCPAQYTCNLVKDSAGNPEGLVCVTRDLRGEIEARKANREVAVFDERTRFAGELHDTVAQSLTMLASQLEVTASSLPSELTESKEQLDLAQQIARTSMSQTRSTLLGLRPPELQPGGLLGAIQREVDRLKDQGVEVQVQYRGVEPIELPEMKATTVYRVVQESISNCIKHSKATQVKVDVQFSDDDIIFEITDNGVGFDPHKPRPETFTGFGIGIMEQRTRAVGGELTLISSPGTGVRVAGRVPMVTTRLSSGDGADTPKVDSVRIDHENTGSVCKVLLVDDHELVRTGIRSLLNDVPEVEIVGEAVTGESAVLLTQERLPDVVLMDINMPTKDGIIATREIRVLSPECKVILLTVYDDDEHIREGIRAGASGYLVKGASQYEIVSSIRNVFAGGTSLPSTAIQDLSNTPNPNRVRVLTTRELEIFQALCDGGTNKEIGELLILSINTVNFHLRNIYQKLGVKSRAQAINTGMSVGLLDAQEEVIYVK